MVAQVVRHAIFFLTVLLCVDSFPTGVIFNVSRKISSQIITDIILQDFCTFLFLEKIKLGNVCDFLNYEGSYEW